MVFTKHEEEVIKRAILDNGIRTNCSNQEELMDTQFKLTCLALKKKRTISQITLDQRKLLSRLSAVMLVISEVASDLHPSFSPFLSLK